jgi:CheY-like chemotaxis protein
MALILVVEDETNIREETMDWLLFEGYEVLGAGNGREALDVIAQAQPDLIISDIRMPVMDGCELLLEIRSNPSLLHIPFIFLTASAERESVRHGMNIGADDYLTKPFTHAEVLEAVRAPATPKHPIPASAHTTQELTRGFGGRTRKTPAEVALSGHVLPRFP